MTQESDVDPGEPAAAAKGYFWRGPAAGEKQAKDIISWAACANLMFAMLASAIGFVVAIGHPVSSMGFNIFAILVGFPSPFLWLLRSLTAVILKILVRLTIVCNEYARPSLAPAKIVMGVMLVTLRLLDWRALRATLAWQRLRKGRRTALAAVFE